MNEKIKKASIISIGNEILSGSIIDTNSSYISSRLTEMGLPVISFHVIADDIDSIAKTLKYASIDSDIILVTGGLGPTDDDVTRQGFADFLGVELQLQEELLEEITGFFGKLGKEMPESNRRQAYIPDGCEPLENNCGTAPGMIFDDNNKLFAVMPGVPSEMKPMFEEKVCAYLKKHIGGQEIFIKRLHILGIGESAACEKLGDLMARNRNPLINCTVSGGIITLHIIALSRTVSKAHDMAVKDEVMLREIFGDGIYGSDGQGIESVVGDELKRQNKTIALAESCTGGLVAKMLTDLPGASEYFMQGWITYSNDSKIHALGVPKDVIEKYGAVSEQTAEQMAQCARNKAGTDFSLAVTGIAGPAGEKKGKPVGLVCISVASDNICDTKSFILSGGRDHIRIRSAQTALNMLRLLLKIDSDRLK